ncbi:MAG TPA: hypothetical protein ENJ04_00160 [Nitrospirae bacterium]|nr:hypothetical protein [Nitrospirota bacterium]
MVNEGISRDVDTREAVSRIHGMSQGLEEAISLLYNAFIYNRETFIDEAEVIIRGVKDVEKELTDALISASKSDESARLFASIPAHIERMAGNLEHIARSIRTKVRDSILFSDKAISEVSFLFQRTREILNTTSDLILARNTFIANYIKKSEAEIEHTANQFATLHEERLVEGLCLPKSSGLYIVMLDSIKRIAYHAKEIAEKLTR